MYTLTSTGNAKVNVFRKFSISRLWRDCLESLGYGPTDLNLGVDQLVPDMFRRFSISFLWNDCLESLDYDPTEFVMEVDPFTSMSLESLAFHSFGMIV